MKKYILTALVFLAMPLFFNVSAQTPLPFSQEEIQWNFIMLQYFAPETGHNYGHPRTPVNPPQVAQEGYVLHFLDGTDLILKIYKDEVEEETLEYTTLVSAETEEVQIPVTLYGTYIIEVVRGAQCFRGEMEL